MWGREYHRLWWKWGDLEKSNLFVEVCKLFHPYSGAVSGVWLCKCFKSILFCRPSGFLISSSLCIVSHWHNFANLAQSVVMLFYLSWLLWLCMQESILNSGDCFIYYTCCKMTSWSLSLKLFTVSKAHLWLKMFGCTRCSCYLTPLCSLWFLERRWKEMQWQVRISHKTRRRNVASHSINDCYCAHQLPVMMFYWWIKMVSEAIECLASYSTASYKDVSLNEFHN